MFFKDKVRDFKLANREQEINLFWKDLRENVSRYKVVKHTWRTHSNQISNKRKSFKLLRREQLSKNQSQQQ